MTSRINIVFYLRESANKCISALVQFIKIMLYCK